jgi:hypothetical protein
MRLDMDGPLLWGIDESDRELQEDNDALTQDYIDDLSPEEVTRETTVTLLAYRRIKVETDEVVRRCRALEYLMESLDEDFGGDENRDSDEYATDAMRQAEHDFCAVVAREFEAYRCERDHSVEPVVVNIAEFIAANDPDMLEDGEAFAHLRVTP